MLVISTGCSNLETDNEQKDKDIQVGLTISAAASLTDALNAIKSKFEAKYPEIKITYNFGSSGTLQQQIIQGAPADLFFSAAEDKFYDLVEKGFITPDSGVDLVGNSLVLITPKENSKEIKMFEDLPSQGETISIGTPETVPAGNYAKEVLVKLGIWNSLEQKIVFAKDVRQVLTYVETGNVDAGIVYHTDALASAKIEIQEIAKEDTHSPIIYPLGILKESKNPNEAKLFFDFMQTEEALSILESYGFVGLLK
ncbi:molybdate ABC transporter substrate-binding protein [Bacillus luteolus]|uniref:Molybdate ABC transporter substrate-binding protein n=2 Tax=Litchfieldia luteola TaxID=682179 RepID=A0ABR9QGE6_9BACI|nr:molybdate ABC transporter substrate-binding protein [Cytobacillus luteolus]